MDHSNATSGSAGGSIPTEGMEYLSNNVHLQDIRNLMATSNAVHDALTLACLGNPPLTYLKKWVCNGSLQNEPSELQTGYISCYICFIGLCQTCPQAWTQPLETLSLSTSAASRVRICRTCQGLGLTATEIVKRHKEHQEADPEKWRTLRFVTSRDTELYFYRPGEIRRVVEGDEYWRMINNM